MTEPLTDKPTLDADATIEMLRSERDAWRSDQRWQQWEDDKLRRQTAEEDAATLRAEVERLTRELAEERERILGPVTDSPLRDLGAWLANLLDEDRWPTAEGYLNRAEAALAEARGDADRFLWWFSSAAKPTEFLVEYLRGVRDGYSLNQWRAAIDAAIAAEREK